MRWLIIVVLVLIILGLLLYPAYTRGLLTGAASAIKSAVTSIF